MSIVLNNTPWEVYQVDGVDVHVKREDLCSPFPGPMFSKVRGLEDKLRGLGDMFGSKPVVGVVDSYHSKAGWGTAWLCKQLGLKCVDFYPVYKGEEPGELRLSQRMAAANGAMLRPQLDTSSRNGKVVLKHIIMFQRAKNEMSQLFRDSIMLPNGLQLDECAEATYNECLQHTPTNLMMNGTWIFSVSSGLIASGVCRLLMAPVDIILHLGYSRNPSPILNRFAVITKANVKIVDEGYSYRESVSFSAPFPCNQYYDLKAWKWLNSNVKTLKQPVVFWNVGA